MMLIIAQPRSASTSLLRMLSQATGRRGTQLFVMKRGGEKLRAALGAAVGYETMPHADIVDLPTTLLTHVVRSSEWYKQHLPPTEQNLSGTSHAKIVLLTRPVDESMESYRRLGCAVDPMQLQCWQSGWFNSTGRIHKTTFQEVVTDHMAVIRAICAFFGLNAPQEVPLIAEKGYT